MANFPPLRDGIVGRHPATQTVVCPTEVVRFEDGSEQRCKAGTRRDDWALTFPDVGYADMVILRDFFISSKGAFDSTITLPIGGATFAHMAHDTDEFNAVENRVGRYTVTIPLRQVLGDILPGAAGSAYPTFAGGIITGRPFGAAVRFRTSRNDLDSGPRYAYANQTAALHAWSLSYVGFTDAELATLIAFFHAQGGSAGTFSFTDPDTGTVYAKCHFADDELEIRHVGPNENEVSLRIEETA